MTERRVHKLLRYLIVITVPSESKTDLSYVTCEVINNVNNGLVHGDLLKVIA